ncbi:MAG: hypothetical protein GX879_04675 [Bacteroidales bacterium]|nr:hypothetical protein [Bacteroidales bacterium]
MRKLFYLFAITLFIVACGNKKAQNNESVDEQEIIENNIELVQEELDEEVYTEYVIAESKLGFVEIGDSVMYKIPKKISYDLNTIISMAEGIEYVTNVLTLSDLSGKLMTIDLDENEIVEEITAHTSKAKTDKGIGIGSSISEFVQVYPDYKIWFTYVSERFVIETPSLNNVQFTLDFEDFIGAESKITNSKSDIIYLKIDEFNDDAMIKSVRIF